MLVPVNPTTDMADQKKSNKVLKSRVDSRRIMGATATNRHLKQCIRVHENDEQPRTNSEYFRPTAATTLKVVDHRMANKSEQNIWRSTHKAAGTPRQMVNDLQHLVMSFRLMAAKRMTTSLTLSLSALAGCINQRHNRERHALSFNCIDLRCI